jgi:hypothetical protein
MKSLIEPAVSLPDAAPYASLSTSMATGSGSFLFQTMLQMSLSAKGLNGKLEAYNDFALYLGGRGTLVVTSSSDLLLSMSELSILNARFHTQMRSQ